MFLNIIEELQELSVEKNILALQKSGCELQAYGVKVGDLKKLVRKYKINRNNELAIELFNSKIYDAMLLACLIVDLKTVDVEVLVDWYQSNDYLPLVESRIGYLCAEHPQAESLLAIFKNDPSDKGQTYYYVTVNGLLTMDPNYNIEVIDEIVNQAPRTLAGTNLHAKGQLIFLTSTIGSQIPTYSQAMIDLYNEYEQQLLAEFKPANIRLVPAAQYIESAIRKQMLAVTRKTCRC